MIDTIGEESRMRSTLAIGGAGRVVAGAILTAWMAFGCGGGDPVGAPCEEDANCNLSGGGKCLLAASGNRWCAYPDPDCSGGYRYSDNVGDGLGDVCIEAPTVKLTVTIDGPGTVASNPSGLSCAGTSCTGTFIAGTSVHLTAAATSLTFLGWSGACRGTAECDITVQQDTGVGAFFGNPGQALWVKQFGGTGHDEGHSIARDSQDNIIVAGVFNGEVNFGGTVLTSAGSSDVYVAKLAATDGSVVWVKRFGSATSDLVGGLAVDESNDIYVTGWISSATDFGGGPLPVVAGTDVYVLKLTSAGDFAWAKSFGSAGFDQGTAIAARGGKVAVVGYYAGSSMSVGGTILTGSDDLFAVRLSSAGTFDWAKGFGGSGDDEPSAVAIDSSSNVVLAGFFEFTATFGTQMLTSVGYKDIFLAKLADATGNILFAERFGGDDSDTGAALAVDTADSIFLAGAFKHTVNFGVGPLTASTANNFDAFLAKFSVAGACNWSKGFGGNGNERRATSVAVSLAGDVVVTGGFNGDISLGGATLSSVSGTGNDVFAARLSSADGHHITSTRAGGQGHETAYSVVQTTDGKFFVAGVFQGFADFGGVALTAVGGDDAFIYAMAPL